jgi:hypothetical protein
VGQPWPSRIETLPTPRRSRIAPGLLDQHDQRHL